MKKTLLSLLTIGAFAFSNAQNVLIIYDDSPTNANTLSLKAALEAESMTVTISDTDETSWDNTNPSLDGFDAVIHLNGSTYGGEMTANGQAALVDYVTNNDGLYLGSEWNNWQFDIQGQMQVMRDLILTDRATGAAGATTFDVVSGQETHPVLAGVPASFAFDCECNGDLHVFADQPSVELMTNSSTSGTGVVIRDFESGHVLNMTHSANYGGESHLSDENVQLIIINFIKEYRIPLVGVNEIDTIDFEIYPNPIQDEVNVMVNYNVNSITITDVTGKVVLANSNAKSINVSSLTKGVYLVKVVTDKGESVKKIIKD